MYMYVCECLNVCARVHKEIIGSDNKITILLSLFNNSS